MIFTNPKPYMVSHGKNQEYETLGIILFHHLVVLSQEGQIAK